MEYLQSWKSWLAAILLICGFALQALGAYLGAKTLPNGEVQRGGGRIEVRAALVDGTVEVSVKDTGIGIAPPKIRRRSSRNSRKSARRTRRRKGRVLAPHCAGSSSSCMAGGSGSLGAGSTFTFTIPMRTGG
jgi:signal transduction histidine kinase